jgi:uridylate kinase
VFSCSALEVLKLRKVVLSLGGSIIVPERIDTGFLIKFKDLILRQLRQGYWFAIICGGGKTCRNYLDAAKAVSSVTELDSDFIGIASTRLNAELVRSIFGKSAFERVVEDPREHISTDKIVVGCGHLPGSSSDFDSVVRAKTVSADTVVNLSNIPYVYSKDPNKFEDAVHFEKISWKDYRLLVGDRWIPGLNTPFDPVAAKEAEKSGITVVIMKGTDLENLRNYLEGKSFNGTVIR